MALKAIISADEFSKLDSALQEHYTEKDGKYLLDAEGVEDVTGLKSTLEKLKAEVKTRKEEAANARSSGNSIAERLAGLEDLLAGMGGEEGAAKLKELQARMEKDEILREMAAGNLEFVSQKLVGRNNKDWSTKYEALQKRLEEETKALAESKNQLTRTILEGELTRAASSALIPSAVEDAVIYGSRFWKVGEKGNPELRNENDELEMGKEGKPIGMIEWLEGLKDNKPHWFAGSTGGGTNGTKPGKMGERQPWQLTREEAADFNRVREADNAAKAAGKAAGFEIVESP